LDRQESIGRSTVSIVHAFEIWQLDHVQRALKRRRIRLQGTRLVAGGGGNPAVASRAYRQSRRFRSAFNVYTVMWPLP
jgi:hypothetical protein